MNMNSNIAIIKKVFLVLILLLVLSACSTLPALFPATPESQSPTLAATAVPQNLPTPEPIRLAEVTFRVTIPRDTPSDGPIQLTVLDEVTGLALNTNSYTMQAETDNIYFATIQLPADAVIKYRYTRGSTIPAAEHTLDGHPVRYRLMHTSVSGAVHDIITRWNDTSYEGPIGRIFGTITDSQSGEPIPDLLITAGGKQTVTRWDGTFLITGLPSGTHTLVTYAKNADYSIFQQGAVIATDSATPANFSLDPLPLTKVTFVISVPDGTIPGVPIRIAGNVYQLGNTFADLDGGISAPASRLPLMTYDKDSEKYSFAIDLPAGAYIRYKYTLGDGFWNAETTTEGKVQVREIIVPNSEAVINDTIENWSSAGNQGAVWFAATTPPETPNNDTVWLQLNPWGWTEPLPMWRVGPQEWVYLLTSPLNLVGNVEFRYCRNAQCDAARDVDSAGIRSFQPTESFQAFEEVVTKWINYESYDPSLNEKSETEIVARNSDFLTGIALGENYHPSWLYFSQKLFSASKANGANTVILVPTWTNTQSSPPVFEPVNGEDLTWLDALAFAEEGKQNGVDIALFPKLQFDSETATWWDDAQRDYAWWVNWFEQYGYFLEHHASMATKTETSTLILGGEALNPALPNGYMRDGFTSGVPADAELWWREMISAVRDVYQGRLAWATTFPQGINNPPPFIDAFDEIYIQWEFPLGTEPSNDINSLVAAAENGMDNQLAPFYLRYNKPIIIEISFPSIDGGATSCLVPDDTTCDPAGKRALGQQLRAYEAILLAVNARDWIEGVVSADYYLPVATRDTSSSIHGKPAELLLGDWYRQWLNAP